jgi:phage baseplate assembly protein W
MSNKKQTTNIDFDIFENDQVFDTATDADRLVDNSLVIPSDDQMLAAAPFLSVSLPIDKNSTNASADGYQMIRGYRNLVKQNFKNLMLTSPGEKVMDPLFGVGVRKFLFELKELGVESKLEGRIHSQSRKYLSYITIRQVRFINSSNDNKLSVQVSYFINPLNVQEFFNYSTNTQQSL